MAPQETSYTICYGCMTVTHRYLVGTGTNFSESVSMKHLMRNSE